MEVVASLSQGRTAAAQGGLFTHKSVPVIFEPPCISFKRCFCNGRPHFRYALYGPQQRRDVIQTCVLGYLFSRYIHFKYHNTKRATSCLTAHLKRRTLRAPVFKGLHVLRQFENGINESMILGQLILVTEIRIVFVCIHI